MSPAFLIVGAQRGGTSWLQRTLQQHPQLVAGATRQPDGSLNGELHFFDRHYDRGFNWYRGKCGGGYRLAYESTPCYLFHPECARRIFQFNRKMKSIVLLRDPVERAWSHYCHSVRRGVDNLSFRDALDRESRRLGNGDAWEACEWSYFARGLYAQQLKNWFDYFSRDQTLIIRSETMFAEPSAALSRIAAFLGVDSINWKTGKTQPQNDRQLDPGLREHLALRFAYHNRQLTTLIGEEFRWQQ